MADSRWPLRALDDLKAKSGNAIAIGPFGSRMKSDCYVSSGVPVIRGNNISDTRNLVGDLVYITPDKTKELRSSIIYADDLFFPHRGAIGEVGIVPRNGIERYVLSSSLMKFTCDLSQVEPLFLFYFFRSEQGRHELLKNASTVGTPGIGQPLSTLKSIRVPVPPLSEQKVIAHILGTLDDKIELNRRMNATLEAMAQALFKSWFVDFDPVRAKAGHFKKSVIGKIPQGWDLKPIREIVENVFDGPHATPPEAESGAVYLGIKNFTGTQLDLTNLRYISEHDLPQWTRRVTPRGGDIVFTYEATLGFFALIPLWLRCCLGRRTALVRPRDSAKNRHYCFHYFVSRPFQDFLRARIHPGSTVDRILLTDFPDYPVLIPPVELVQRFEDFAAPIWARIHNNIAEARTLAALRDTLLPKLLNGDLSLADYRP